ncbi:uncharacterized protein Dwil_GK13122 [Drosophila willistoni]|uniref:Prolyl 4-hydroxylase N-terminal domain-containing protein n=1 Tax=Drosophila willistoni TaxID=7260 RepID=B4NGW8_DROWI|nr:uncharacterized protein Dwil_GK13122 [Drosophila willistoni]
MQMPRAGSWLCFLHLLLFWPTAIKAIHSLEHLESLLATENFLIDELRNYIDRLDHQLVDLKREVAVIEQIHGQVGEQVEEHMGNPLNVLTILKRFESLWPRLEEQANDVGNITWSDKYLAEELELPTESDYEDALGNLLHLQSVYDLQPAALSVGLVNGQKFGSAMSWSDCLEMAIKSGQQDNANYAVAKYWLETAMEKITSFNNATYDHFTGEQGRGKIQILEASLNLEYRAGKFPRALAMAEELLLLLPTSRSVQKAKTKIEQAMSKLPQGKQRNGNAKREKFSEQQLIAELCREVIHRSSAGVTSSHCRLDKTKPQYILTPLRLEILRADPYIALHHDVLTIKQTEQLVELIDEDEMDNNSDEPAFKSLQFSKLAQRKLSRSLYPQLGQDGAVNMRWRPRRHSHHNVMETVRPLSPSSTGPTHSTARVMLNLQPAQMGGAMVFPQLQLGINVPHGSLLYWRTCNGNEFSMDSESDYRSRHAVCPVVLGEQLCE